MNRESAVVKSRGAGQAVKLVTGYGVQGSTANPRSGTSRETAQPQTTNKQKPEPGDRANQKSRPNARLNEFIRAGTVQHGQA